MKQSTRHIRFHWLLLKFVFLIYHHLNFDLDLKYHQEFSAFTLGFVPLIGDLPLPHHQRFYCVSVGLTQANTVTVACFFAYVSMCYCVSLCLCLC